MSCQTGLWVAGQSLPKVTIAIPTRCRLTFLRRALASALAQSYCNLEVIVFDNASSDGTAKFMAGLNDARLVSLRQESDVGMAGNWNACLERASGEFFLLLSDDDYLEPTAIEKLVAPFLKAGDFPNLSQLGISYCRIRSVDNIGRVVGLSRVAPSLERSEELILNFFRRSRQIHPCAVLFRTAALRAIGGYFASNCVLAADAFAWMKIVIQSEYAAHVPEILSNYTLHSTNLTKSSGLETWIADIETLIELCVTELRNSSRQTMADAVAHAGNEYLVRFVTALLVQSGRSGPKLEVVTQLYRARKHFSPPAALLVLMQGLCRLILPPSLEHAIKRIRVKLS